MKSTRKEAHDTLGQKAEAAMEEAVAGVIYTHKLAKRKLAVWRDGKAVLISPKEAMVMREGQIPYGRRK